MRDWKSIFLAKVNGLILSKFIPHYFQKPKVFEPWNNLPLIPKYCLDNRLLYFRRGLPSICVLISFLKKEVLGIHKLGGFIFSGPKWHHLYPQSHLPLQLIRFDLSLRIKGDEIILGKKNFNWFPINKIHYNQCVSNSFTSILGETLIRMVLEKTFKASQWESFYWSVILDKKNSYTCSHFSSAVWCLGLEIWLKLQWDNNRIIK